MNKTEHEEIRFLRELGRKKVPAKKAQSNRPLIFSALVTIVVVIVGLFIGAISSKIVVSIAQALTGAGR
jgi:hypothetical protein